VSEPDPWDWGPPPLREGAEWTPAALDAADIAFEEAAAQARATHEELRRQRARKQAAAVLAAEELEAQRAGQHGRSVDGATFVLDAPSDVPVIWGSPTDVAWAAGEALMAVGPPGVGKSTLANQLVRARLGLDAEVLGMPVTPGARRVLYLAMDRPSQIQRAMARVFTEGERRTLAERLVVWKGPPPTDFAGRPESLLELARHHDADTVVIDSLKDAALGLSEDEVGAGYNRARQMALTEGVELLELHHNVKRSSSGGAPKTLEDVYGSRWLTAGAGSVLFLYGEAGDPVVELRHLKQVVGQVGPWQVLHDHDTGRSVVYRQADLLMLASAWSSRGGLTVAAAAEALFSSEKPSRSEVEKARRKLLALVREGHLVEHAGSGGGAAGNTGARYFRTALQGLTTTHEPTHATPPAVSGHEAPTPLTAEQVRTTHAPTHATHAVEQSRSRPPLEGGGSEPAPADPTRKALEERGAELFAEHAPRSAS
jgi:replicative DNA helicase